MAKILMIENDPHWQQAFKRLMKDHEVTLVATGTDAIALLENGDFDVVFSDYDLDGPLSGEDVYLWAKINRPDLMTKYAFCAYNDRAREICEESGITYLEKPARGVSIKTLVNEITGAA